MYGLVSLVISISVYLFNSRENSGTLSSSHPDMRHKQWKDRHLLVTTQSYHQDPLHPHAYQDHTLTQHIDSSVGRILQLCTFLFLAQQIYNVSSCLQWTVKLYRCSYF